MLPGCLTLFDKLGNKQKKWAEVPQQCPDLGTFGPFLDLYID